MAKSSLQLKAMAASLSYTEKSRVYFEDYLRVPMYGKFVRSGDSEELAAKGYVRFVSSNNIEAWDETGEVTLSRIIAVHEIRDTVTDSIKKIKDSNFKTEE